MDELGYLFNDEDFGSDVTFGSYELIELSD